jgi:hypothetical protein
VKTPRPFGVIAALVVVCSLAAGSSGCAASDDGVTVTERASAVRAPRTPSAAATTSLSEGHTGLRIVSVVPPPFAAGPWTGSDVIVAYLPLRAPVVPSRCRLTVNGRRQDARVGRVMLSPAQPELTFSWSTSYPPGTYRFRVTVVARGGRTAVAEWTSVYR